MERYLISETTINSNPTYNQHSYLPEEANYITDKGFVEYDGIPVLSADDNILSELELESEKDEAHKKATSFLDVFIREFVKNKTSQRSYSKIIQNKNELPDVVLDWIFQNFRVTFLFSNTEEDYFCVTKYDERTKQYESKSGPLGNDAYQVVAEKVMEEVG